ncbi:hypothetical protein M413DRAFT_438677, partial [Hebeloma cylindrosporum]
MTDGCEGPCDNHTIRGMLEWRDKGLRMEGSLGPGIRGDTGVGGSKKRLRNRLDSRRWRISVLDKNNGMDEIEDNESLKKGSALLSHQRHV